MLVGRDFACVCHRLSLSPACTFVVLCYTLTQRQRKQLNGTEDVQTEHSVRAQDFNQSAHKKGILSLAFLSFLSHSLFISLSFFRHFAMIFFSGRCQMENCAALVKFSVYIRIRTNNQRGFSLRQTLFNFQTALLKSFKTLLKRNVEKFAKKMIFHAGNA